MNSLVGGLPLVELRGNLNGYVAPYVVVVDGERVPVLGIRVGDSVYQVDLSVFEEEVMESLERYQEAFSDVSCAGDGDVGGAEDLGVNEEYVDFGGSGLYEFVWAGVRVLSDVVRSVGLSTVGREFLNYSRFYPVKSEGDAVVRLGPAVFLEARSYGDGCLVSLKFSYPSIATVYRSAWDVYRFTMDVPYVKPVKELAERVVSECGLKFFRLPVVRI